MEAQQKTMASSKITLVKIVRARRQVVAGTNYCLDLTVDMGDHEKRAQAVVWKKLSGEHELTSWTWR